MTKKRVLVLGYFGYETNQLDGQTIKTRSIHNLLKENEISFFSSVAFFDTQTFQRNKLTLIAMLSSIRHFDVLFYLPAHNNLKFIFPLVFIICKICRIQIHYVVVGGWLADFLRPLRIHRWMLSKISRIYPQTKELCDKLFQQYGFTNVVQLHNYRMTNFMPVMKTTGSQIRLVFMARVHPKKGIDTIFNLVQQLKLLNIQDVKIDIYGPIWEGCRTKFMDNLGLNKEIVSYKGIIQPEDVHKVITDYDLMLFPTKYFTEGFPGSVLDSLLSGVPVIASEWQYAHEFIIHRKTGIIVEFDNENQFVQKVIETVTRPNCIDLMRKNIIESPNKFSANKAWEILKLNL